MTALSLVPATVTSTTSAAITIRLPNGIAIELTHSSSEGVAMLVAELTSSLQ